MNRKMMLVLLLLSSSALFAVDAERPLSVYTTFYPLTFFTQQIGGKHVAVTNPLPETEDAAFWVPAREIVRQYHAADLIVMNGTNFERGFNHVTLPESKVVNSTAFLKGQEVILNEPVTHAHGKAGEHTHQGMDGHTWVDPRIAKKQARAIADALSAKRPGAAAEFKTNLESLNRKLDELDKMIRDMIVPAAEGKQLLTAHPAYNYLARTYGLKMKSFHLDPSETPSKGELEKVEKFLKEYPAALMIWEEAPLPENEKLFREKFKLKSVVFSPCEVLEKDDAKNGLTYLDVMKRNVTELAAALK